MQIEWQRGSSPEQESYFFKIPNTDEIITITNNIASPDGLWTIIRRGIVRTFTDDGDRVDLVWSLFIDTNVSSKDMAMLIAEGEAEERPRIDLEMTIRYER